MAVGLEQQLSDRFTGFLHAPLQVLGRIRPPKMKTAERQVRRVKLLIDPAIGAGACLRGADTDGLSLRRTGFFHHSGRAAASEHCRHEPG